tara:strand:- start:133 stop:555 length:423 start_codon:yes stop_codon:yes gene_type:complete
MAQQAPEQTGFDGSQLYVWVKGLEMKVNNLLREVDVVRNDLMKKNSSLKREVKNLNQDLIDIKRQQDQTVQKMDLIIKELKQTAGIEEVQTLKKYVEFWNPINFVTQKDLDRAIESKINIGQKTTPEVVEQKEEKKVGDD